MTTLLHHEGYQEVIDKYLYMSTMKDALQKRKLILIDPGAGNPQMWLGFTAIPAFEDLTERGEK